MRAFFAALVFASLITLAEDPVGVVSYIGSTTEVDESSPSRALPHIEVVDWSQFEACKEKASPDCRYEYAIPYILQDEAKKLERDLSEAWARFDARTAWRIHAAVYGSTLGCSAKQDRYLGAWDHTPATLEESEFCDGEIPDLPVTWFPLVCPNFYLNWEELGERYAEAFAHAYATYYPDYIKEVSEAVMKHAPLALWWQSYLVPGQGSTIVPVASTSPSERWAELTEKAQSKDVRGAAYMQQALPGMSTLREVLRRLPGEEYDLNRPGIKALEEIKRELMNRGDIFPRAQYWAGVGGGPEPEGEIQAATPEEYQIYGVVPIMRTYAQFDVEISPHLPIFWVGCITPTAPPAFVPIPIPLPIVHAAIRTHTGWQVVPEGFPIEGITGDPVLAP